MKFDNLAPFQHDLPVQRVVRLLISTALDRVYVYFRDDFILSPLEEV